MRHLQNWKLLSVQRTSKIMGNKSIIYLSDAHRLELCTVVAGVKAKDTGKIRKCCQMGAISSSFCNQVTVIQWKLWLHVYHYFLWRGGTLSLSCSEIENDDDILAASPSLWHGRKWVKPQKLFTNVTAYDKGPYDLLKGKVALYFHFLWWSLVTG